MRITDWLVDFTVAQVLVIMWDIAVVGALLQWVMGVLRKRRAELDEIQRQTQDFQRQLVALDRSQEMLVRMMEMPSPAPLPTWEPYAPMVKEDVEEAVEEAWDCGHDSGLDSSGFPNPYLRDNGCDQR